MSSMRRSVPEIQAADLRMWNSNPSLEMRVTHSAAVSLSSAMIVVSVCSGKQEIWILSANPLGRVSLESDSKTRRLDDWNDLHRDTR